MHEPAPEKVESKSAADKKVDKRVEKDATSKPEAKPRAAPDDRPSDYELSGDAAGPELPVIAPEKRARSPYLGSVIDQARALGRDTCPSCFRSGRRARLPDVFVGGCLRTNIP
jgi:hypothetical protein